MTREKLWSLLAALLLATPLAVAAPPFVHTASAAAGIETVIPDTGPVGTTVRITGTAQPGIAYTVRWANRLTGQILTSGFASSSGVVSTTVTVPPAASDKNYHFLFLVEEVSGSYDLWPFYVTPAMSSGASTGHVADSITVTGNGFGTSERITVTWDGTTLASANADSLGSWSTNITIPPSVGGDHTIGARGDFTATPLQQAFTVAPNLVINPASGPPGTALTINGTGFRSNESTIEVLWQGTIVRTGITASATGSWSTTYQVPTATAGAYTIDAKGSTTTAANVPDRNFALTRSVSVSPTAGYTGTVVAVTGTGFAGNVPVTITYDLTPVTTTPAAVASTASGNVTATFAVPSGVPGAHTVVVNDGTGMANATFTITSSLSITTTPGSAGEDMTINGLGFPSYSPVTFTFDGVPLATRPASITTDAGGTFSATAPMPEAARGTHTVRATSGATFMASSLEVSPKLSIAPESGTVGTLITVSGKGFGSAEAIALTLDGLAIATTPAVVSASTTGSFSTTIALPSTAGGTHTIKASDRVASAQANVNIIPKVSTSSTTSKVGDRISVTGTGFPASAAIAATVDGVTVATDPAPLSADSRGTFTAHFTVPETTAGSHTVSFTGGKSTSQAAFYVSPFITISPDDGNVDNTITISGTGYAGNSTMSVTYDGSPMATIPATMTSTTKGSFQATATIPRSTGGKHAVAASDAAGHTAQAPFTTESTPPLAPSPSSPPTGARLGTLGPEAPTLSWSPSSDPSGVTYTLQVSRQPSFTLMAVEQTGLISTDYTLSGKEKLRPGHYYWRVKAVDGASNESDWSETFTLKVGILPGWMLPGWMPAWVLIALIVVLLGVIAGVVYFRMFYFRREY